MRDRNPARPAAPAFELALLKEITGTFRKPDELSLILARCEELGHLLSPVTVVSALPPGVEVQVSAVLLDVERDTYPPPGSSRRALAKAALDRIGGAAGVSWDATRSGILHQELNRVVFTTAGSVLMLDGRERAIAGTKDMDVRDGSPAVQAMIETSANKAAKDNGNLSRDEAWRRGSEAAQNQIRELRKHLLSHAATKAGLRALRQAFGIRAAYDLAELLRPFFVPRPVFTGRTEDPVLRPIFGQAIADHYLGSSRALFGQGAPAPRAGSGVIDVRNEAEKAADAAGAEDDDLRTSPAPTSPAPTSPAPTSPAPTSPAPTSPAPTSPATPSQNVPRGTSAPRTEAQRSLDRPESSERLRLPKKGGGGPLLREAETKDLEWWEGTLDEKLTSGTADPRWRAKDEALVEAIRLELDWRAGADGGEDLGAGAPW